MLVYSTRPSNYASPRANRGVWYPNHFVIQPEVSRPEIFPKALSNSSIKKLVSICSGAAVEEIKDRFASRPERTAGKLISMLSAGGLKVGAETILFKLAETEKNAVVRFLAGALKDDIYGPEVSKVLYMISLKDSRAVIWPVAGSLRTPAYVKEASGLLMDIANFDPHNVAETLLACLRDPLRNILSADILRKIGTMSAYHKAVISGKSIRFMDDPVMFGQIRNLLIDIGLKGHDTDIDGNIRGRGCYPVIHPLGWALLLPGKRNTAIRMLVELGARYPLPVINYMQHLKVKNCRIPSAMQAAEDVICLIKEQIKDQE